MVDVANNNPTCVIRISMKEKKMKNTEIGVYLTYILSFVVRPNAAMAADLSSTDMKPILFNMDRLIGIDTYDLV